MSEAGQKVVTACKAVSSALIMVKHIDLGESEGSVRLASGMPIFNLHV